MSNFSSSHSVFEGLLLQTCKKQGLFGKGLIVTKHVTILTKNICKHSEKKEKNVGKFSIFSFPFNQKLHHLYLNYPFPKRQILDSFKLKGFADDNFTFDEKGRKFVKQVENTVGKVEIAHYDQFLLFPQCFQKTCTADT